MSKLLLIFFIIMLQHTCHAGVSDDMENLFESLGGGSNITSSGAYKSQSGGYYTGGSIYARIPTKSYNFANFQPPSINAGCGGIDIFMGSFSYINAEQFIKALRNVASNSVGYSFNLAMQTFVPQVYNTMQKLNDISREINNMNMNSCETVTQIMGGMWPKSDIASKQLCQAMGTSNGKFGDWARARQDCGVGGKRNEVNSAKSEKFKHQLGDEFNIAWEAMKGQRILGNLEKEGSELAEFFMSISGTIIGKKNDSIIQIIHKESLAKEIELIDTLLLGKSKSGKNADVYSCIDRDKCLEIKPNALKFDVTKALVPKIENTLRNIATKMRSQEGFLTNQEKSLIENTQIPILKIIAVQNAFMVGNSIINIHEYAEPIAYDYVLGYLEKILDFMSINIGQLEKVQMNGTNIESFKKQLSDTRKMISERRFGAYQRMLTAISVIEKTNMIEKKMQHMFSNYNEIS
jgi:conjugative transfer pilus assembly protein TraH